MTLLKKLWNEQLEGVHKWRQNLMISPEETL